MVFLLYFISVRWTHSSEKACVFRWLCTGRETLATPLYCRACGIRFPTDSAFCPVCGASQTSGDQSLTSRSQGPPVIGTGRQPVGHMLHQRYRLLHTVGQGGMGAVYAAQDTQL